MEVITESFTMSVYCGNLPHDIKEKEVDDLFYKYGRIRDIHIASATGAPSPLWSTRITATLRTLSTAEMDTALMARDLSVK